MYININVNIFDIILALFFSFCLCFSTLQFLKLGVCCGGNVIGRSKCIYVWRNNLIMAIANLIVYIVLKGNLIVFLVCLPIGFIFAYALESFVFYHEFPHRTTISDIVGVINIITIIGILLYHFL